MILRFGAHVDTREREPGLHWHLPPPLATHEIVNVDTLEREEFGGAGRRRAAARGRRSHEAEHADERQQHRARRASSVQYRIGDPFAARYRIADRRAILRDAAQAAMREVVGRTTIDDVLSRAPRRDRVRGAGSCCRTLLDRYEAGIEVDGVELQDVQAPAAGARGVRRRDRGDPGPRAAHVNEAEGYANEVMPERARARRSS